MRLLAFALLAAALGYGALCAAMLLGQRQLLYMPGATRVPATSTDFVLEREDAALRGWRIGPEDGQPLLYFGGNAERVEANRADFARWFPGHRVYLLAYRGYGASDGTPAAAALKADALALYDAVGAAHGDVGVDVIGRSVGSGVASHVAAHRPVARLALITPFDDLARVARGHYPWLPVRALLREHYTPTRDLATFEGRVLILRADRDTIVPPARADALATALPAPPQVVTFAEAGHNDIQQFPGYADALSAFFHRGAVE